jgi:phenylalanyl-tRNA synthetase beta chain
MFELDLDAVLQRDVPEFKPVSKHQAVERDIAVLVNESVSYAALLATIWSAPNAGLLRDVKLFDIYRPKVLKDADPPVLLPPEKSMAVRLTLGSEEASLTEVEIESVVQAVLTSLAGALGARQRV